VEISTGGRKPFFKWLVTTPAALVLAGVGVLGLGASVGTALGSSHNYDNAKQLQDQILSQRDVDAANRDQMGNPNSLFGPGTQDNPNTPEDERAAVAPCNLTEPQRAAVSVRNPQRLNEYAEACTRYQDNVDLGDTMKTVAIATGIVGGVAVVGTVVYYFVDSKQSGGDASRAGRPWARVAPWGIPGGGGGGISIVGQF
jgi:hypothetical protein